LVLALDYLRERRIVHRDIKLENILIREIGGTKEYVLSDFGLACWTGEKAPIYERCGTPGYIAPEVLNANRGKPILDHKGDIFSLGVIAHIMYFFPIFRFLHQSLFTYTGNIK
jgi:calcium/calmodulin-dependent protein kinase I